MGTERSIRCDPHLPVKDLHKTLDHYRDVLGFQDEWTWANEKENSKMAGSGAMT